jgi:hypothetical protein
MTFSEPIETAKELVSQIDELEQVPVADRRVWISQVENLLDALADAEDEYGDDSDGDTAEDDEY